MEYPSTESWNVNGPAEDHPRLEASKKRMGKLYSKQMKPQKRSFRKGNFSQVEPRSTPPLLTRCFLIFSIYAHNFITKWGHPRRHIQDNYFELSGTPVEMNIFTKLTIFASSYANLDKARNFLYFQVNQLKRKTGKSKQQEFPVILLKLKNQHCTLCFAEGHFKASCQNCSYCGNRDHIRRDCKLLTPNPVVSLAVNVNRTNPKYAKYRAKRRELRRTVREPHKNMIWFKIPNVLKPELVSLLQPIGLEEMLPTLAIDIEGNGSGGVGNVHISGWFGPISKIQTLYYAEVKNDQVINPNTRITGLQIPDLTNGTPFEIVRGRILGLIKNCRVITQGSNDLNQLGISWSDLHNFKITFVNLQSLWSGQPLGLKFIDAFFFPKHPKLKRDDPGNVTFGHSPERDSRVTLLGYMKYLHLLMTSRVPSADDIRQMVNRGQDVNDW